MKVEIHLRDSAPNGKRLGLKGLHIESCRVYKEPGDGLRLDNFAVPAHTFFNEKANEFVRTIKSAYNVD